MFYLSNEGVIAKDLNDTATAMAAPGVDKTRRDRRWTAIAVQADPDGAALPA